VSCWWADGVRAAFATVPGRVRPHRLVPVLLLPALGACGGGPNLGTPDPVTEQGREILGLWHGSVVAGLVVGLIVWGLIVWSVVRYRRRDDDLPSQTPHNIPLEVLYTVAPLMVIAGLVAFTIPTQDRVIDVAREPDLVVEVVGFQWSWAFRYPEHDVTVTTRGAAIDDRPELVLPVGRVVRFRLETTDVVHSFFVPEFLQKRDLIPAVDNAFDVLVEREGAWRGRCAEYCGLDHWKMLFDVRAVPAEEFDEWLADAEAA
jgi:cytochrome c oxidase subunit II